MGRQEALNVAIELYLMPSSVRSLRKRPLANNVSLLLAIAAGEADATAEAISRSQLSPVEVQRIASFYIEQVLLAPHSDSYRVLGCDPTAGPADLRRNLALLMKWLHPDVNGPQARMAMSQRVTNAWETLKTPARRTQYDEQRIPQPSALVRSRALGRRENSRRAGAAHGQRSPLSSAPVISDFVNETSGSIGSRLLLWFHVRRRRRRLD